MSCNIKLHEELFESGDIVCTFCDFQLTYVKRKPLRYDCCDFQTIINDNGMNVCKNCGVVQGYESSLEYVDFHLNKHKIKRKSVYHREYHINNALINIQQKYNIEISFSSKNKIERVFREIGNILNEVNGKRKRMISINFILRKVLSMMEIPYNQIPISK